MTLTTSSRACSVIPVTAIQRRTKSIGRNSFLAPCVGIRCGFCDDRAAVEHVVSHQQCGLNRRVTTRCNSTFLTRRSYLNKQYSEVLLAPCLDTLVPAKVTVRRPCSSCTYTEALRRTESPTPLRAFVF